jgi:TetR/AcrR family transcriptional repressor of mexCD-oprJ operon
VSAAGRVDHRRAVAQRNAAAILDACERLMTPRPPRTMVALASEAGVSRPTLYAHFKTVGDVVEAAVARSVDEALAAIEAARPTEGPAGEALLRMAEASWSELGRFEGLSRSAAEYLEPGALHRTHEPIMDHMRALVDRGRAGGDFRTDLPAAWLVSVFYSTVHAAYEHAVSHGLRPAAGLKLAQTTVADLFAAR